MTLQGGGNPESYGEGSLSHVGEFLDEATEQIAEQMLTGKLTFMLLNGGSNFEDFRDSVADDMYSTVGSDEQSEPDQLERLIWKKVEELDEKATLITALESGKYIYSLESGPIDETFFDYISKNEKAAISQDGGGLLVCEFGDKMLFFEKEPAQDQLSYRWVMVQELSEFLELVYVANDAQSEFLESLVDYVDLEKQHVDDALEGILEEV